MASFTVLYDACVLYPASLRDLLMRLALTGLYRAKWTDRIHEEWIRSLLNNRDDLSRDQLERTRTLMNQNARDALVEGYQPLIESLDLPDDDDRHVLAAAIRGRADAIVTFNIEDFPEETLSEYGIHTQHPDDFLIHQMDLSEGAVCTAVNKQLRALNNPPIPASEYLRGLENLGLIQFTSKMQEYREVLQESE